MEGKAGGAFRSSTESFKNYIEKIREEDNACTRAPKKTVQVLRKPGASPLLFGKFLMSTTAFLALEDIADNLPPYTESVLSSEMSGELREAYEELEKALRSAIAEDPRQQEPDERPAQCASPLSRSSVWLR